MTALGRQLVQLVVKARGKVLGALPLGEVECDVWRGLGCKVDGVVDLKLLVGRDGRNECFVEQRHVDVRREVVAVERARRSWYGDGTG